MKYLIQMIFFPIYTLTIGFLINYAAVQLAKLYLKNNLPTYGKGGFLIAIFTSVLSFIFFNIFKYADVDEKTINKIFLISPPVILLITCLYEFTEQFF